MKLLQKLGDCYDYDYSLKTVKEFKSVQENDIIIFKISYDNALNECVTLKTSKLSENDLSTTIKYMNLFFAARQIMKDESLFETLLEFYMTIPFLEAGKMPLSDIQKAKVRQDLENLARIRELSASWQTDISIAKYHLFTSSSETSLSFGLTIKSMIKEQPECLLESSEWTTLYEKFISKVSRRQRVYRRRVRRSHR